jgi:transposase
MSWFRQSLHERSTHSKLEKIMSALDDLKAEVVTLNQSFSSQLAAINAKLAGIQSGTSDADIESVVTDLKTLQASIDAETAALTAPAAAPEPPPAG